MSLPKKKKSRQRRRPIEAVLHAVLLRQDAAIPATPEEVADFDARHRDEPPGPVPPPPGPPRFSWEQSAGGTIPDNLAPFPVEAADEPFAMAARTAEAVSPETRKRIEALVRKMEQRDPPSHA